MTTTEDNEALEQEIPLSWAALNSASTTMQRFFARLTDDEPFLVEPGWTRSVFVRNVGGPSYRVLFYADGTARFEHRCDRGARGVIICAPLLQLADGGHRVVQEEPLTITPSILCADCGTHGFVTKGYWA